MASKETNEEIEIEDSNENFETWINKSYISDDLRKVLQGVDILFVPMEGFRDKEVPLFPAQTDDLFQYIKTELSDKYKIDICIEDKDYSEIDLHFDLVNIGKFVLSDIVAPLFLDKIKDFIKKRLSGTRDKSEIKLSLTIVNSKGNSKCLNYEGSVENFSKIQNIIKGLDNETNNH